MHGLPWRARHSPHRTYRNASARLRRGRCCGHKMQRLHRRVDVRRADRRSNLPEAERCRWAHGVERCLVDGAEDEALVLELHFALLRMHIHIHRARRDVKAQRDHRIAALRHHRFIGIVNRFCDGAVFDDAAIHDERLPAARALEHGRLGEEAADFDAFFGIFKRERKERLCDRLSVDGPDGVVEISAAGRDEHHLVVIDEAEGDLRVRERELRNEVRDMRAFRVIRLKEFLACRRIEKEVFHLDRRAEARADVLDFRWLAARDLDGRTEVRAHRPRLHGKARDRRNRRQGFAAEAERANRLEVASLLNLARRMAEDGEPRILFAHALAVVCHAQEARAAREDLDFDFFRARVNGIFDELFDDGSRSLDDFARRNLVDRAVIQHMNRTHERPASFFACSCSL